MVQPKIDLSEFAEHAPHIGQHKVCWFIKKLDDQQRAKITAAKEAGYSYATMTTVLRTWGITVSSGSMSKHFRNECCCAPVK